MVNQNITQERLDALKKIKQGVETPKEEEKKLRLVKNSFKTKDKKVEQYKINVPKKYLEFLGINDENCEIKAVLDKQENKINIEIKKNG